MHKSYLLVCLASVLTGLLHAEALSATDASVETVLTQLDRPSALAVRPDANASGHEIYIAEAGAGRVIRIAGEDAGIREEVITGFDTSASDSFLESPGPLGLMFLDRARLVVAGGTAKGQAFIRLYELAHDRKQAIAAGKHEQDLAPTLPNMPSQPVGFHSVARTQANDLVPDLLILAALSREAVPGLWKAHIRAGTLDDLQPFAPNRPHKSGTTSSAVAVGPHGYIAVAESSADGGPSPSRLQFLNPIDGTPKLQLPVELGRVIALAYSPRSGNLYAADFGSMDGKRGGIYRLDDAGEPGKPKAAAVKIAEIERPTALAFAPDGALYVTALGTSDDGDDHTGRLLKLTGEL